MAGFESYYPAAAPNGIIMELDSGLKQDRNGPLNRLKVNRALISVSDKSGLTDFGRSLAKHGIELIATGGTLRTLLEEGLRVIPIEKIAHFPEMLDGRVKTLQPEIFAGILARKSDPTHIDQISKLGIGTIDLVVCNFYPFEMGARKRDLPESELIELIDIGGPSIVRAASKNFESVCVVPSPVFYGQIVREMDASDGEISLATRKKMALEAFGMVTAYDVSIYNALSSRFDGGGFSDRYFLSAEKFETPKYGQNPDQDARIFSIQGPTGGVPEWKQLAGDMRSYNNYLDIASSFEILKGFDALPAAATVKHGQISGFAFATTLREAYELAHACDTEADFGNTTVLNRKVDEETALIIGKNEGVNDKSVYTEIVVAPSFDPVALKILETKQKKKMRIIQSTTQSSYPFDAKLMEGLVLVQKTPDYNRKLSRDKITIETAAKPSSREIEILLGLWEVVRRVESNGVVIGNGAFEEDESGRQKLVKLWTLGVGTFRKRNGATKIALDNAGDRAMGAYCASDGFFPFPDSIQMLGQAGIRAIIQPGGSVSDRKVIAEADRRSMSMVFTHERAFKH